jgi:hypothetical protein
MGPRGPREEIQEAIDATGCKVREDPARGGMFQVDCPDYDARAALVEALAWRDAGSDGEIRLLALELTRELPELRSHEPIARTIHAAVRDRVRYVGECGDMIQDPMVTWNYAAGDCDCTARLVLALLRSLKVPCVLVGLPVRGRDAVEISHVCPAWQREDDGLLFWLETTIPCADFGEDPREAAARWYGPRARAQRPDILT